ncbi:MAG: alpha-L-fucosidase [Acidobacteriota bacterium]|nr:alpha-L-fucosidase [Acidobacteriota bacterium]
MPLTRRSLFAAAPALLLARRSLAQQSIPGIAKGPYTGAESLRQFRIPEWFRDFKFGMWAHWGPQSAAEDGDWYARNIYIQDSPQYKYHVATYGHPSKFGHKDLCPLWHGNEFDPDHLIQLYKKAGAKYFMSMGVHHDNFDLWNSKFQPRWNSVATGPKKDVVGLWRDAARKHGLKFAVSEHLSNSYNWLAVSHYSDKTGPLAGVPYDGQDPAYSDLYHPFPKGVPTPPPPMSRDCPDSWKLLYFNRIKDLIDHYQPDLLYTDGGIPFGDWGFQLVSHYYNTVPGGVYTSKNRPDCDQGTCALDIERGVANDILPHPWQTDTCIGQWHYKKGARYKTPKTVVDLLCDIVSRNGNLMLNVPLPNSGKPDDEELKVVEGITKWMAVNSEGIYSTRPWKVAGNAPPPPPAEQQRMGFNERNRKDLTAADVRFTSKGDTLYAFVMGWPEREAVIEPLALGGKPGAGKIRSVELLGHHGKLNYTQDERGLRITLPPEKPSDYAITFKILGA